ncbi:glycerol-3-phosphate dehydrogenase [Rhodoligotrophos appendicifer]|uniref:glycerol-3-phosphate dehydrogenase n=1 Tax=Rhodoligotrophos appendicifer TaxID=987056 RepID=UPI001FEB7C97|nr:glycerol-3-phosphate dehydrogenase [Rhodoligotrophos appendicifer]
MRKAIADIAIIGGGINGCGIARDAIGRGLSVVLFERSDLGSGSSSASTKLLQGGSNHLRPLDLRSARASLAESAVLQRAAPHIIRPLRFILPYPSEFRAAWRVRSGFLLHNYLGGRSPLPSAKRLDLRRAPGGQPLNATCVRGYEYWDYQVDDSRLVILTALDAASRGAVIRTRTEVLTTHRKRDHWVIKFRDELSQREQELAARVLVNAAGPWVSDVSEHCLGQLDQKPRRLVKVSHIIVPRQWTGDHAYMFHQGAEHGVFAFPYERNFTLIGATKVDVTRDPSKVRVEPSEVDYLCARASECLKTPIDRSRVVSAFSSVHSLHDDPPADGRPAKQEYVLDLDTRQDAATLLTVHGGTIITFRRLAEDALRKLKRDFPRMGEAWTRLAPLPGGRFPVDGHDALVADVLRLSPACSLQLATRLVHSYGTFALDIARGTEREDDWGMVFGADLSEREVQYLVTREWARTAEDIVWRRSKLGYHMTGAQISALNAWMSEHFHAPAPLLSGSSGQMRKVHW